CSLGQTDASALFGDVARFQPHPPPASALDLVVTTKCPVARGECGEDHSEEPHASEKATVLFTQDSISEDVPSNRRHSRPGHCPNFWISDALVSHCSLNFAEAAPRHTRFVNCSSSRTAFSFCGGSMTA